MWQTPLCSQATSCQTPPFPLQKHRQLDSHLSMTLQAAEKVLPKFLWDFSWKCRGSESLPKPWGAGFWILALSPFMLQVLLLSLALKIRAFMS